MPTPSQCPISPSSSRAVWSPSRAASVISGPVRLPGRPSDPLEQVARDRGVGVDQRPGLAHEGVAAGVLLPAAAVAALAAVPARDDLHVAELAGDAEAAALDLAVDEDAAADAGAEGHHHHVGLAARGAEPPLGPDRGVGVVVDEDRQRTAASAAPPAAARRARTGAGRRRRWRGPRRRSPAAPMPTAATSSAPTSVSSSSTTSTMVSSTTDGLVDRCGVSRRARWVIRPSGSTRPPATLVPPMSMPMARRRSRAAPRRSVRTPIPSAASAAAPIMPASLPRLARANSASGRCPRPVSCRRNAARVGLEQQVPGIRDAAADDDQLGVEDRHHGGRALAQPRAEVAEQLQRGGVALLGGPGDVVPAQRRRRRCRTGRPGAPPSGVPDSTTLARLAHQGVAAGVLLPAAAVAAAAPDAVRHDPQVAELGGHAPCPAQQPAVDDHPAADARCRR